MGCVRPEGEAAGGGEVRGHGAAFAIAGCFAMPCPAMQTGEGDLQLPRGPWLDSLRRLDLHAAVAAANLDLLAAAPCLEALCLRGIPPVDKDTLLACAALPRLRRLSLRFIPRDLFYELVDEAARRHPGLELAWIRRRGVQIHPSPDALRPSVPFTPPF